MTFIDMPQARRRATAAVIVIATMMMVASPALAGFEWLPPAQAPKQIQAPAQPAPALMPQNAMPSASPYAGAENFANPVPPMAPPAASSSELVINPYPMTRGGYGDVLMGVGPVEQAMMAESRALNPVQLPGGLNTAGKARAMAPTYPASAPTDILPMPLQATGDTAISPMPGGESLAPLPGYEAAPAGQPAPVVAAPIMAPVQPLPNTTPISSPPKMAMKAAQKIQPAPVINTAPMPASIPSQPAPVTQGQFDETVGFGNDLPLALALSQVIPEDYALFFETKVDADQTNVSWEGGKPWNQVLQDMLAPLGLRAEIQPNLVMIRGA